jgi:hypothetical protein
LAAQRGSTAPKGQPSIIYSAEDDHVVYKLTVVDLTSRTPARISSTTRSSAGAEGHLPIDRFPRVYDHGVSLVVDRRDGSRVRTSLCYNKGSFNMADAIELPECGDKGGRVRPCLRDRRAHDRREHGLKEETLIYRVLFVASQTEFAGRRAVGLSVWNPAAACEWLRCPLTSRSCSSCLAQAPGQTGSSIPLDPGVLYTFDGTKFVQSNQPFATSYSPG